MPRLNRLLLPLLPVLLLAAGCASVRPAPWHPDVSLTDLHLGDPTLFETPAVFAVRIDNDVPAPCTVVGASYRITLNGHRIGKGLSNRQQTIPGLSSGTDEVIIHLGNLAMAQQVKDIVQAEQLSYQVACTLYLQDGSGSRAVESLHEGVLQLRQFLPDPAPAPINPAQ